MADFFSIISSNYLTVGANVNLQTGKYVNVDPEIFQGRWSGKYADGTKFELQVSDINGFRAKVKYQSGNTVKYQEVLIKNDAFRVGDTKFTVTRKGVAEVKTVITNAANGSSSLETAYAKQNAG